MILADSSIWIDHVRSNSPDLLAKLSVREVLMHPFVIGELALGNLPNRATFLDGLHDMPRVLIATDAEVLALVERNRMSGCGIGWVDAHLLASARLANVAFWTRDRRLHAASLQLGLAAVGLH